MSLCSCAFSVNQHQTICGGNRHKATDPFTGLVHRKEDKIKNLIGRINDSATSLCAIAERKMLQTIGGDCDTAIGGLAEIENHNLKLKAQLFSDNGQESFEYELIGREADASFIGKSVGEKLLNLAGEKFKKKWIL